MNYNSAIKYIENATILGSKKGFDNFERLLNLLGNPQEKLKFIHIAGTNGKGSTSAMLNSVLIEQGYNTGLFTSPHLVKYNERFLFNNISITDDEFSYYVNLIKKATESLFFNSNDYFCFFEIMTAIAFMFFYDKKTDYVVLETGLGGRMDSTNIIKNPILSIITSISIDHTQFLGDTLEQIAYEKAGIIKNNCPVVVYPQKESVYKIFYNTASSKNAKLYYIDEYKYNISKNNFNEIVFSTCNPIIRYDKIKITLIGNYQLLNTCNVLLAIKALRDNGIIIYDKAVYRGLEKAKINGRMEVINQNPMVIIDGAHNEGGIEQLYNYLNTLKNKYNITVLFGVLNDKNYCNMLNKLYAVADKLIITQPDNKRAKNCNELVNILTDREKLIGVEENYHKALKLALNETQDILICCGSIYLIGDIRRSFNV